MIGMKSTPHETATNMADPRSRWRWLLLGLLVVHLLTGLVRLPRTVGKKLEQIDEYEKLGRYEFFLGDRTQESAAIVERLVQSVPEDRILYWEGEWKGQLELAAALLFPRLLVRFDPRQPARESSIGKEFARLTAPDGSARIPVIQGRGRSLGLRWQ